MVAHYNVVGRRYTELEKKVVRTDRAPEPVGPYSQAVIAGGCVFCSGQIALDTVTGALMAVDIRQETKISVECLIVPDARLIM